MDNPGLSASAIYAINQGHECTGDEECHFCATPCTQYYKHGEYVPPLRGRPVGTPGIPRARPSSPYVCAGCWLWKRPRVSAHYLSGFLKDGITPKSRDWLITPTECRAIGPDCGPSLWKRLFKPPLQFFLCLSTREGSTDNRLQSCKANCNERIKADTTFFYTLHNVVMTYTIYELEQAGKVGTQGREGGVRELINLLGKIPDELLENVITEIPKEERPLGRTPAVPDPRVKEPTRPVRHERPRKEHPTASG